MKNLIFSCLLFTGTFLGIGSLQLKAQDIRSEQQTEVIAQSNSIDFVKIDFSTPEASQKSIAFILSIALTIGVGYIPAVRTWASKEKNKKAIKIALAALPIVVTTLIFGGSFNINELIQAIIGAIGSAIFLHTVAIKPLTK